ncbi:cytochrome c [Mesorhizobium sp. B2-7-1]|uniref:cytochrome c n=1 Tax=Mesorhizobium sp. B2-7-1 TaxID=2589909 RepID=UPI001FEF478E|nr:cytochrome c [Mesorhizobium sp. B2-7-1]
MAAAAKAIAEMFGGKRVYEPVAFKAAADTLSARTGAALIAEFPRGTLGAPSGARLEIDEARPEFEALARHIGRLADALADKAGNAPPEITADMRMTGPPMDGGSLLGKRPGAAEADLAKMPAERLLHLILQDCASCIRSSGGKSSEAGRGEHDPEKWQLVFGERSCSSKRVGS